MCMSRGCITVDIGIHGTKGGAFLKGLTVDNGATHTVLPRDVLEKVGALRLPRKIKIELGDGRTREASVYAVGAEIADREGPAFTVTFEGAKPIVGAQTLESLGLKVDPVGGILEPTRPSGLAYFYPASIGR